MRTLLLFCASLALFSFKPDHQKWLLVIHSDSARISNGTLQLDVESKLVAALTADGGRETRGVSLHALVQNWSNLFQDSPPNAVLVFKRPTGKMQEHIVILQPPKIQSDRLTFQIVELGEPVDGPLGEVVLFIDAHLPVETSERNLFEKGVKPFDATTH